MNRFRSLLLKNSHSRKKKFTLFAVIAMVLVVVSAGSVWAGVPPGTFGYTTVCHRAGTPQQRTLIVRNEKVQAHVNHGDSLARCADPLPETSAGVPIDPAVGYHVEELVDGVYWLTEGTYQIMFVTTGEGVIVVDAPPSIGQNIVNGIASVTAEPITHVIYSHSHADHISGAGIYPAGATVIAHEDTLAQLERDRPFPFGTFVGGGPVPLPTITFSDSYTLNVGSQTLQLDYNGPHHEPGNIYVYAPQQKVLLLIDVVFPGWIPFTELAVAEDIPAYFEAHDTILSYDFDYLISGHLGRLGTRADVEQQQEYILDIQANAAQALQTVDFFAIAGETGFENPWLLFDTYLDAVGEECASLTLAEWGGVLGGADIWTFSHCAVVIESLRID